MELPTSDNPVSVVEGDCLTRAVDLPADSFDAIITDPPYGLSFMGKEWDNGVPGVDFWSAFLRVVKPGGYLAAMGGTRTHHRLMVAIEDAGWEIRDCLMWLYGSGFPKGQGCLKPAWEPIVLARKPGPKVLPLGIDDCRIATSESTVRPNGPIGYHGGGSGGIGGSDAGRYPANVVTSYPEDEYILRSDVTPDQRVELLRWMYENAERQVRDLRQAAVPPAV